MATKYFMNGGVNNNWSDDTNWSTTASSGPNNTTHATSTDDVILDAGSPNCTVNSASTALTLTCTGYAAVLRYQANLTVSGTVLFAATQAAMTTDNAVTRTLIMAATGNLTSAGLTIPCSFGITGASTITLQDAAVVAGNIQMAGSNAVLNASTMSAVGLAVSSAPAAGTTVITLTGGTYSGNLAFKNSLTFNGNVTVSGTVKYGDSGAGSPVMTYTSGTMTLTGAVLELVGGCTLDTGGMTWPTVNYTGSSKTITLNSLFLATTASIGTTSQPTFAGTAGFTIGTLNVTAIASSSKTITFTQGNTYTISTALNFNGSQYFQWTLASSSATLLTAFVLEAGATQNVSWVNATRLDSSSGLPINSLNGVLNDPAHPTLNWSTPGTGAQWCYS